MIEESKSISVRVFPRFGIDSIRETGSNPIMRCPEILFESNSSRTRRIEIHRVKIGEETETMATIGSGMMVGVRIIRATTTIGTRTGTATTEITDIRIPREEIIKATMAITIETGIPIDIVLNTAIPIVTVIIVIAAITIPITKGGIMKQGIVMDDEDMIETMSIAIRDRGMNLAIEAISGEMNHRVAKVDTTTIMTITP